VLWVVPFKRREVRVKDVLPNLLDQSLAAALHFDLLSKHCWETRHIQFAVLLAISNREPFLEKQLQFVNKTDAHELHTLVPLHRVAVSVAEFQEIRRNVVWSHDFQKGNSSDWIAEHLIGS